MERLEQLLHGDLAALELVHDALGVHAVSLLDEAQQVLLVHAGGGVDVGVHLGEEREGGGEKERRRAESCRTEVGVVTVHGHKGELKSATKRLRETTATQSAETLSPRSDDPD